MATITISADRDPETGKLKGSYSPPNYDVGSPPVASAFLGTFTQGNTFTVMGSNLSSNRQSQLFYDDFSYGTVGQPISGGATWTTLGGQPPYRYDSTGLSAGKRSAYLDMQGTFDYITGITFEDKNEIHCEHWLKYNMITVGPDDGSGGPQMKLTRIGSGADLGSISSNPNLTLTMLDVSAGGYIGGSPQVFNAPAKSTNDTGQNVSGYIALAPDNSWHKVHMAGKVSTLGQTNGWRYFKTDQIGNNSQGYSGDAATASWTNGSQKHFASPNGVVARTEWDGEPWSTLDSDDINTVNHYFGKVVLPFFSRVYQVSQVWVAGFWLNDSAERVVVSTSSDTNTALKTGIIQPNISRTGGQWQFQVETGNLPDSGDLYAYVVNANRKISAPLKIR
jgi:hypothetical protein